MEASTQEGEPAMQPVAAAARALPPPPRAAARTARLVPVVGLAALAVSGVALWELREHVLQAVLLGAATLTLAFATLLLARRYKAALERGATAVGLMKSLQAALASEEAKLQAIFRNALESIVVIDEAGRIERVNPATERMFGYAAEELVGRNVSILMPEPHRSRHDGYLDRYLRSGVPRILGAARELTARRRDGTEFPVYLGVAEHRVEGARRFTGTIRDVSHAKLTDAVLRAETRIATLLARASTPAEVAAEVVAAMCSLGFACGLWLAWDARGRQWRVQARSISPHLKPEQVGGLEHDEAGPEPDGIAWQAWRSGEVVWRTRLDEDAPSPRAAAALGAGLHACAAVPVRSGPGTVAVIELFSSLADPRSDTLDAGLRNIALQVGQLLSRVDAERELQAIVKTVPSAVFQARMGGRDTIALSYMSAQIEALWGESSEAVLANPRRMLWKIPRAHRQLLLSALSEAATHGGPWDVTVPIAAAQGTRWMRIHAAPARQSGDAPVWDGLISDVTEHKVAEQQIVLLNLDLERRVQERTRELELANAELDAFASSVSHDLRAPLRAIRGYAEMLRTGGEPLAPESASMLERIVAQGEHMETLIEALLELSHISRYELRRVSTDLSAVATGVLEELARREPARTVEWRVEPNLRAWADPRLVRVLFENLLANAWKFTRKRPDARIHVGATRSAATAFYVRDNGAGFDPAYAARLFQPFQRLHPASQFEGTGIGLATVERIVRRHGGRIRAESTPGAGATFHCELPADEGRLYTRRA